MSQVIQTEVVAIEKVLKGNKFRNKPIVFRREERKRRERERESVRCIGRGN